MALLERRSDDEVELDEVVYRNREKADNEGSRYTRDWSGQAAALRHPSPRSKRSAGGFGGVQEDTLAGAFDTAE